MTTNSQHSDLNREQLETIRLYPARFCTVETLHPLLSDTLSTYLFLQYNVLIALEEVIDYPRCGKIYHGWVLTDKYMLVAYTDTYGNRIQERSQFNKITSIEAFINTKAYDNPNVVSVRVYSEEFKWKGGYVIDFRTESDRQEFLNVFIKLVDGKIRTDPSNFYHPQTDAEYWRPRFRKVGQYPFKSEKELERFQLELNKTLKAQGVPNLVQPPEEEILAVVRTGGRPGKLREARLYYSDNGSYQQKGETVLGFYFPSSISHPFFSDSETTTIRHPLTGKLIVTNRRIIFLNRWRSHEYYYSQSQANDLSPDNYKFFTRMMVIEFGENDCWHMMKKVDLRLIIVTDYSFRHSILKPKKSPGLTYIWQGFLLHLSRHNYYESMIYGKIISISNYQSKVELLSPCDK
jgi:hypothetical protein